MCLAALQVSTKRRVLSHPILSNDVRYLGGGRSDVAILHVRLVLREKGFSCIFDRRYLNLQFNRVANVTDVGLQGTVFLAKLNRRSLRSFLFRSTGRLVVLASSFSGRLPVQWLGCFLRVF